MQSVGRLVLANAAPWLSTGLAVSVAVKRKAHEAGVTRSVEFTYVFTGERAFPFAYICR